MITEHQWRNLGRFVLDLLAAAADCYTANKARNWPALQRAAAAAAYASQELSLYVTSTSGVGGMPGPPLPRHGDTSRASDAGGL